MKDDFNCRLLDGVKKGVKRKVCPNLKICKMACSIVYSKSLLRNVYKHRSLIVNLSHLQCSPQQQAGSNDHQDAACDDNPITDLIIK